MVFHCVSRIIHGPYSIVFFFVRQTPGRNSNNGAMLATPISPWINTDLFWTHVLFTQPWIHSIFLSDDQVVVILIKDLYRCFWIHISCIRRGMSSISHLWFAVIRLVRLMREPEDKETISMHRLGRSRAKIDVQMPDSAMKSGEFEWIWWEICWIKNMGHVP